MKMLRALLGMSVSGFLATNSFAAGAAAFGNEVMSARVMGQGGIGVAGEIEDPSLVFLNPAGLPNLEGTQASLGVGWENLHGKYQNTSGQVTKMRSVDAAVPNVSVTHRFLDGKLGTGLSVQAPYGLETHWPGDSALRYVATNSKLAIVTVSPAVGYRVNPMVSFGGGVDYVNAFDAKLERHISVDAINSDSTVQSFFGPPTLGAPDANSRMSGTAANWGYHVGLQVKPSAQHAIGIVYHSKVKLNVKGSVTMTGLSGAAASIFGGSNYETAAYTDLFIPQSVQLGYAFKPNDRWMWEVNSAWYDWTSNRDVNIRYAETDATRLSILNTGNPTNSDRHNGWSAATGFNYKQNDRWQWRAGIVYLPNATPDSTFTPSVMDLSRYLANVGTGIGLAPSLTLDLSYSAVFYHNRTITNTVGYDTTQIPGYNVNGKYTNFTNLVVINLTYRMK